MNFSCQAVHVWAKGTRPSQAGPLFRKELAESRSEVAMEAIQFSVMGRESRVAFFLCH